MVEARWTRFVFFGDRDSWDGEREGSVRARFQIISACWVLFLITPHFAWARSYDAIVDVTGKTGSVACAEMQAALNPALGGRHVSRKVLIRGQLGTARRPVDFTMFRNEGASGAGGRPWPYGVCHAFWPVPNGVAGEGIVNGYPDPLRGRVVREGDASALSTPSTVVFKKRLCQNFSIDRKLAIVQSGRGQGQVRRLDGCDSETVARVVPDWETTPDASSRVAIVAHRIQGFGQMDLHVDYDLEVHYRNDEKQGQGEYGVFADMGMACYFVGDYSPNGSGANCPMVILDGVHRSGHISIFEYGRRDDGEDCAPTWIDSENLTNRSHSIIWQAYGQGVQRGSDSVRLDLVGQGDRDNVGVVAAQTWSKDFHGWRIKRIGTGVLLSGSLNNTLHDPYVAGNEFGVVVGANEPWGSGFPRWKNCFTGFCEPFSKPAVGFNFRGGVVEGNACGNFVMFGGYAGEVDRTFIETASRGASNYAGHSVLVGAGVCDAKAGRSQRQGLERSGRVCADDLDCAGTCLVDPKSKRTYAFQWDASLVSNRGSSDWFAFVLGKGTRAEYLKQPDAAVQNIRVMGSGFGGESGVSDLKSRAGRGLYFFPTQGASVRMDADDAIGTRASDHLPPYDYYVSMESRDLERFIERPSPGRYALGRFPRRATCTGGEVSIHGDGNPGVAWTIKVQPESPAGRRARPPFELIKGGRVAVTSGVSNRFQSADFSRPFVPHGAEAWLEISSVRGAPRDFSLEVRCWEDKW